MNKYTNIILIKFPARTKNFCISSLFSLPSQTNIIITYIFGYVFNTNDGT